MANNYEDEIWVSDIQGGSGLETLPAKQGICVKMHGSEWPEQNHFPPILPEHIRDFMANHNKGVTMARQEMPEVACMFSKNHFRYIHDFIWFHGFMGVTGKLAEILKTVDLGEGGELIPIHIIKPDGIISH